MAAWTSKENTKEKEKKVEKPILDIHHIYESIVFYVHFVKECNCQVCVFNEAKVYSLTHGALYLYSIYPISQFMNYARIKNQLKDLLWLKNSLIQGIRSEDSLAETDAKCIGINSLYVVLL